MFLLCNPREPKEEQISILEALPVRPNEKVVFISEHSYEKLNGIISHIPVKRLFPHVVLLRGFLAPFFPYLRSKNPPEQNVMLIHDEIFSTTMIHAVFTKVFLKSRVIVFCAENLPFSLLKKMLGGFFSKFVDSALCTSREAMERVKQVGIKKVMYCPMPICNSLDRACYVQKIKRVGFIGRLVHQKGIHLFCEAMKQFPNLEARAYGKGGFEKEIKNSPVRHMGSFQCSSKALNQIFSEVDLLVVPSITMSWWKEQFGRVIVEAMDRGVIVIGSNSGAIPEVIGDERLIFEENNVQAIIQKIQYLISLSPDQLLEISKSLRKRYEDHFGTSVIQKTIKLASQN